MKKSKEYKISCVLFSVCLVMYVISIVTGLISDLHLSIYKITQYLGFTFFSLGLLIAIKSKIFEED